jgi:hypothetical protein
MFFEHAGSAVAVDLESGDVTDTFTIADLNSDVVWSPSPGNSVERKAHLLARSALAASADPLRRFTVPVGVRDSARQAALWQDIYDRQIELPVVAAAPSYVPPRSVQMAAHQALDHDLPSYARARAEQLSSGGVVPQRLVQQMQTYFSRHKKQDVSSATWLAWGGDSGRTWASKLAQSADNGASTLNKRLAESDVIDYDTLRLLPRAFAAIGGPHTATCDGNGSCSCGGSRTSSAYPSARALTYLALGGDEGREWSNRVLRRYETKSMVAAGPPPEDEEEAAPEEVPAEEAAPAEEAPVDEAPAEEAPAEEAPAEEAPAEDAEAAGDQDEQDGSEPHVYAPINEFPSACMYCGGDELAEVHQDGAVNYRQASTTPEDAHHFTERADNADKCDICGKAQDDTLHKQAALAAYYLYKDHIDAEFAANADFWAGKDEGVTAGGAHFGVDWDEDEFPEERDAFDRADSIDADIGDVFWARRGTEDDDPLTYYVGHTGDDQMLVDQLYVFDGSLFYQYLPDEHMWEQAHLGSPEQIYEIDDEAALSILRALSVFPGEEVDLRDVDPSEALLMEEALPHLDDEMLERTAIVMASAALFVDDGYTPEERAQNAQKQVRDANGRFAKSGSRVATGNDNRLGTIGKIDPATQSVEVTYDDGQSAWVPAKDVKILAGPKQGEPGTADRPQLDLTKIEGKPRSTSTTPKALLKTQLPVMDPAAVNAVTANYSNFIERERAGRAGRAAAQGEQNRASAEQVKRQQKQAQSDYERRLQKIHGTGKSARDWIDRIYNKIIPGYKRRPSNPLTAAGEPITDPTQSDVAPVYMAEVDEANQSAVLELLALVPASTEGNQTQVLRYSSTGWISDPKMLRQLQSTAPPAIVALDEATFNDTLEQVKTFYTTPEGKAVAEQEAKEAEVEGIAAAAWGPYGELLAAGIPGIADTPGDVSATERLKRYWKTGEGGVLKVRWNTPGDMTRCMKHLRKYMPRPDMAAGYCAKLHHEMTGEWPGDRKNIGRRGSGAMFASASVKLLTTDEVIAFSALVAASELALAGTEIPNTVEQVPQVMSGAPFVIPILAPIGVKSGDGRHFAPLSLTTRELPLPLLWQIQTQEGHDASVIVGRIDSIDRSEDGSLVNARGVFDVGPYGQEAERLVRHKFLRGVSVDLDEFEATARSANELRDDLEEAEAGLVRIAADDMTVTSGRVMGATLVAKPAFQEVTIELAEEPEEVAMVADGIYIGTPESGAETEEMIRSALTASGIPLNPPDEWFEDPRLNIETPLTVLDDGRVYGHIATWSTDHVGLPFSTRPPRSRSNYAYFQTGLLRTASGKDVHVGQITLAGGHAPLNADAAMAVKHYDDTASAFCDVHAGEDAYGIWVAGALRPSVTGEQIRSIRAAAPSGDWRPISGRLELVAVCQVNVPGFPVTRARVASGHVYALVAAGTAMLSRMRAEQQDDGLSALLSRVEALEGPQREALNAAREAALARITPAREERNARLAEAREAALRRFESTRSPEAVAARERFASLRGNPEELFRDVSKDKRDEMAKKGEAMPGGGYPIANVSDLKNAIRAYGRAASGEKAAVRRHIKKRARALGKTDLIPESWASLTTPVQDVAGEITDLMQRMALIAGGAAIPVILSASDETLDGVALIAVGHYPNGEPWDPGNHPRDDKGKFRQVIAELRSDLEGEAGTAKAVEGLDEAEQAANSGDTDAAQQAAKDVLTLVDKLAENTEDKGLVQTLRDGYTNLADAVANLPLAFGNLNEKYRYSDLPPELKGLIDDLVSRAEKLVDPEHQDEAAGKLKEFMAGGDVLSQPQLSAELSKILRFMI